MQSTILFTLENLNIFIVRKKKNQNIKKIIFFLPLYAHNSRRSLLSEKLENQIAVCAAKIFDFFKPKEKLVPSSWTFSVKKLLFHRLHLFITSERILEPLLYINFYFCVGLVQNITSFSLYLLLLQTVLYTVAIP